MITKITETNIQDYKQFLTEAYQYLELLEQFRGYQFLLNQEMSKAYTYLNNKSLIDEDDLSDNNATTFKDYDTYEKYYNSYKNNADFQSSCLIIADGDRDIERPWADKRFKDYETFYKYLEQYDEGIVIIYPEDRGQTFHSLEQYFNYVEAIKKSPQSAHFLLKLPMDEGILNVNANTRTITIPPNFVSTIVQKDSAAETIIFSIDRFIENIDLANSEQILIQWRIPGTEPDTTEDHTTLIDSGLIEYVDEKIKFGWPITNEVTERAGKVQFSVVFYTPGDPSEPDVPRFRLNTLPNQLTVQPALQTEINGDPINPALKFYQSITNNRYPGQGGVAPTVPSFKYGPGKDLANDDPQEINGKSLEFEAQAVVSDNGKIIYTWWHKPENCQKTYDCSGGYYTLKTTETIIQADYERLIDGGGEDNKNGKNVLVPLSTNKYVMKETEQKTVTTKATDDIESTTYTVNPKETIDQAAYDSLVTASKGYFSPLSTNQYKVENEDKIVFYHPYGTIFEVYRLIPEDEALTVEDTYFINTRTSETQEPSTSELKDIVYIYNQNHGFQLYNGTTEHKALRKYEKFTGLRVPEDTQTIKYSITGKYYVTAVNTKPGRDPNTKSLITQESKVTRSTECDVFGPVEIVYENNLPTHGWIRDTRTIKENQILTKEIYDEYLSAAEFKASKDYLQNVTSEENPKENANFRELSPEEGEDASAVKYQHLNKNNYTLHLKRTSISTTLSQSTGDLIYGWKQGNTKESLADKEDADENALTVSQPGYYQQNITAEKNRKTSYKESNTIRMSYHPRPTGLVIDPSCQTTENKYKSPVDDSYYFDGVTGETCTLSVLPYLRINSDGESILDTPYQALPEQQKNQYTVKTTDPLYSDRIDYRWYRQVMDKDKDFVELTSNDVLSPPASFDTRHTSSITVPIKPKTVRGHKDQSENGYTISYKCIAKNVLSDEASAESDEVIFVVW